MSSHAFDTAGLDYCPFMPVFGAPAISIERGSGTEVWDTDGKRYLDFLSGIAVVSLGHANPVIADAISRQANTLLHVSNFFTNPQATAAAIKVNELLLDATGHAGQIFFTNSGAEANECALKLARKFGGRGRHTVVSALGSFHGRTLATLAATGQPTKHEPFAPMPEGFKHVPWGDLDALRASVDGSVAAVLIEPLQGEGGVNPAPPGYLAGIREICDEVGALMMVDEIQTGFGRTGTWFAIEHAGIQPDIMCLAKGLGGGFPMGAFAYTKAIRDVLTPGAHGSTFGGSPLACAAGLAAIEAYKDEGLIKRSGILGANMRNQLRGALEGVAMVRDIRGLGLMIAVELRTKVAPVLKSLMINHGVIALPAGPTVLRLLPPLVISEKEIDIGVQAIAKAIKELKA